MTYAVVELEDLKGPNFWGLKARIFSLLDYSKKRGGMLLLDQ